MSQQEEAVIRGIMTGVERWKAVKARQHDLKLPSGVYLSDLALCVLLAELPGTEDEIIGRIQRAGEMLRRFRADSRVSAALMMGSDATAILALASIPDIDGNAPAPYLTEVQPGVYSIDMERLAETVPCQHCGGLPGGLPPAVELLPATRPEPPPEAFDPAKIVGAGLPATTSACEHVGSDGKCSDCTIDRTADCSHCDGTVVVAQAKACRADPDECDNLYCAECAGSNLNEHGYCSDCEGWECDGCQEDIDRGTEKGCVGDGCKQGYCSDCAEALLNDKGLCADCGEDEEVRSCDGCEKDFISSRLTACEGEDCESDFCAACAPSHLEDSLCSECSDSDVFGT